MNRARRALLSIAEVGNVSLRLEVSTGPRACGLARRMRLAGPWLTMAAAVSFSACWDDDVVGPEQTESAAIVSDPAPSVSAGASSGGLAAATAEGSEVVYISMPPDSIPGAELALIRNPRNGIVVTAAMVNGGLDPVPITATAGDTLELEVRVVGRDRPLHFTLVVPAAAKPRVVRTFPPHKKRDVVLNAMPFVIFTEPIDPAALAGGSVELIRGSELVPGELRFRDPDHLTAVFVPLAPLAAGTTYRLVVTQAIRDLDGDALEAAVAIEFTTANDGVPQSRIAFVSYLDDGEDEIYVDDEIYVMNADGSGVRRLTHNQMPDAGPVWSPDGSKIAFTRGPANPSSSAYDLYVMNADGSGVTRLTYDEQYIVDPAWSPDGRRIAFAKGGGEIYVINADGTGLTRLTDNPGHDNSPTWSPDGTKIAFASQRNDVDYQIYVMNADGSGVTRLTDAPGTDISPAWSPDGTNRIAFVSGREGDDKWSIYTMNADGSGVARLPLDRAFDWLGPAWSPDGTTLAVTGISDDGSNAGLYLVNADGSEVTRVTCYIAIDPAWSPGGVSPPNPDACQLAFAAQPTPVRAGEAIVPPVRVVAQDPFGNVGAFTGNVSITTGANPGGGSLSGTTTVAAVDGVATFADLTIDRSGVGYTLVTQAKGMTGVISAPFNILPAGPAAELAFTVRPSNTGVGLAITPAVEVTVRDALGNTAIDFAGTIGVWIGANPGGVSRFWVSTVNAVAGVAKFANLRIPQAGSGYTLVAGAQGLVAAASTAFDVVAFGALTGQVAFVSDGGNRIRVANADGSQVRTLTDACGMRINYGCSKPAWSPDGTRIAFNGPNSKISVASLDGSGLKDLTTGPGADYDPAWSPEGSKIAFISTRDDAYGDLYVMNPDGSGVTRLTNDDGRELKGIDQWPTWSPDGGKIAFQRNDVDAFGGRYPEAIWVVNADGSSLNRLGGGVQSYEPAWSPDGSRIAFRSHDGQTCCMGIWVMTADGSGVTRLTNGTPGTVHRGGDTDEHPTWTPDGRIVFTRLVPIAANAAEATLHVMNPDGSGVRALSQSVRHIWMAAWSPPRRP